MLMLIKLAVHPRHRVPGWVRGNAACSFSLVFCLEPHSSLIFLVSLQLYWGRVPVLSGTVNGGKGMEGVIHGQSAAVCIMENTC